MTTQAMIRGYSLNQTTTYLEAKFDADTRRRSLDGLSPVFRSQINSIEPGEWYPRDYSVALFRANRDRFPDSPLAWYELGRALAAAGQNDDARRALQHSLALEPDGINPSHDVLARLD